MIKSLNFTSAIGAKTGRSYIEGLRDSREVWLNGERVDVTTHPAFSGMMNEMARLYDIQHEPQNRKLMTFISPLSGNQVSYSYKLPVNKRDLLNKWKNSHLWMKNSWGQLPRIPDFMSNVVVGLYDFRKSLGKINSEFEKNAIRYHQYCQEHDIFLTHALGDPQIDRSKTVAEDHDLGLRVIERNVDGIIIRGAKQLATFAPLADEILVYMSPSFALREHKEFVVWCALPMSTPGLKVLCREPHSEGKNNDDHVFASRYDEQDAMIFFDDVLVPWERVFLLDDADIAFKGFYRLNSWSLYSSQIRFYHRLQTFIGLGILTSRAIGVDSFRDIQNKLGELVSYSELVRLALKGMNEESEMTDGGLMSPGETAGPGIFAAQISTRLVEILREIGASGIIMQPSQADLNNPELYPFLEKYMRGSNTRVEFKSKLFKMVRDLTGDCFGIRQELYERWHRGDLVRNRINLLTHSDFSEIVNRLNYFIEQPVQNLSKVEGC
jgi:4-hydroxyphenylacetate 3-monooxygenase oxygenase component